MPRSAAPLVLWALTLPAAAQTPTWDDPAWYAAPPAPLDLALTVDAARAVQATIGPAGGMFTAEGASGDRYTLAIPPGALLAETRIAIWPVAAAAGLPEGAGPFSGVVLEPEGLELARTGWLEITPARPIPPASRALWGFYGAGADARPEFGWPGADDRIVIPLDHFSGAGVSIADRIDLGLDRWRQRFVEDRVRAQLAETLRRHRAIAMEQPGIDASEMNRELSEMVVRLGRIVEHGYRRILASPAASCSELAATTRSVLSLEQQRAVLGLHEVEASRTDLAELFSRYWSGCFPEEVETCLRTGDLQGLVGFVMTFERQQALLGLTDLSTPSRETIRQMLRAGLERCGRFKLEVEARGQWRDPAGVNGDLSFRVEVPLRLVFQHPDRFEYIIEGEAPAVAVAVGFRDEACWRFLGHAAGRPMLARVTAYEFRRDASHAPLRLDLRATAPEIFADISCEGHQMRAPVNPMVWAVAHRQDRNGEVFRLGRFQARGHPLLWEMDWTGQGVEDGLEAQDATRLRLIHIAQ
jgi:hypothetical protein